MTFRLLTRVRNTEATSKHYSVKRVVSNSTWAEIRTAYASGIGLRELARSTRLARWSQCERRQESNLYARMFIPGAQMLLAKSDKVPSKVSELNVLNPAGLNRIEQRAHLAIECLLCAVASFVERIERMGKAIIKRCEARNLAAEPIR